MKGIQLHADRTTTIPLVVPVSWIERLNTGARTKGITRSALIREAIQTVLFQELDGVAVTGATDRTAKQKGQKP